MEASTSQLNFQVTAQDFTPSFDPSSPEAGSWLITFATKPSGVQGQVTVPGSQYNAQAVAQLIIPIAAEIEAVHQLGKD